MGRWHKTCHSFKNVRNMIEEDTQTASHCMRIMYAMEICCDELTPEDKTDWEFYDEFKELKSEIHDQVELMDEDDYKSCENTVNYYLGELYDLCDCAGVWLET